MARCVEYSVLHDTAWLGLEDQVRELISKGYPLNLRNRLGMTALHCCVDAYRNCFDRKEKPILSCIEILIEAGADIMIKNNLGHTPLEGAMLYGVPLHQLESHSETKTGEEPVVELFYSPYGMDSQNACRKMGELTKVLVKYYARRIGNQNWDSSWLSNYAMIDMPIGKYLTEVFGILEITPEHIINVTLLRSLMGERLLQVFLLAAIKHGKQTNMNLYSMREPFYFMNLLIELDHSVSIKKLKKLTNFRCTPLANLTDVWGYAEDICQKDNTITDVWRYLENTCKKDKTVISQLLQIFKIIKKVTRIEYSKYLSLLLRLRNVDSITLIDLQPGLLNYVHKHYAKRHRYSSSFAKIMFYLEIYENSLIQVYLFIIIWLEHRPEDFSSGELLRQELENIFEGHCSLHYLLQLPNTKAYYDRNLTSFIELEQDKHYILNLEDVVLKLIDFLIPQAVNRSREGFGTYCDGGTALHFSAASFNIKQLAYLVFEKGVYLYAIDNRYQTFLDILQSVEGSILDKELQAMGKSMIETLRPSMLLRPLKTLCAESIVNNQLIFQSMKTQLRENCHLVKFVNLHVCPKSLTEIGEDANCQF